MPGPYREAVASEVLRASTLEGDAALEVAPRHVLLNVGEHLSLSVTERFAELTRLVGKKKRPRKRALVLKDARLLVARTVPTDDFGVWHEATPGLVTRLFGLRKPNLESGADIEEFNERWNELQRLIARLEDALGQHYGAVLRATEVGAGADRVLIMDFGDRLLFHVRRLFRERPRSAFEVHRDGTVVVLQPALFIDPARGRRYLSRRDKKLPRFNCQFRFGVAAIGDFLRFSNEEGDDLGRISLPWIRSEDRVHLAKIITNKITGQ